MEANALKNNIKSNEPHLKLVKSTKKIITGSRIYINTLIPGFSYVNSKGEIEYPHKCVLL